MPNTVKLTPSELKVLIAFSELNDANKVALNLEKSRRTIHFHCANINAKFGTNLISKSYIKAIKSGLIPIPTSVTPVNLNEFTDMEMERIKCLLDNDNDQDQVRSLLNLNKRTFDCCLYIARKKVGAFDTPDLLLRVMVSL